MNGKTIKAIREELGYKQREFAPMVHLKKNTIAKIESGLRDPTPLLFAFIKCQFPQAYKKVINAERKGKKLGKTKDHKNQRR